MNKTYISNRGNDYKYIIRKAIENEKNWVVEVYVENRNYPNIISGQFKRLKDARNAIGLHNTDSEKFPFWGNA